jgi:ribosomal-protein-alanine N-acetyltransferase
MTRRAAPPAPAAAPPRVTVRAVCAADRDAYVAAARASRALHRPWVSAPCDAAAFERLLARFDGVSHFGFVVCAADDGRLAGAIHLTNVVRGAFRSGYLGYHAFAGNQGRGLMTAGLNAVVRHAFGPLKLHRVEANIQPGNVASIALVQRCGFAREGYSPAYLKIGGRWRDHERWARVRGRPS